MPITETILVVEDEALIAMDLELTVREMGFDVVSAVTVAAALAVLATRTIHFAILDFRVGRDDTSPVAEVLRDKRIPFALCSGTDIGTARRVFEGAAIISKPYSEETLRTAIQSALN